jgi:two-component sensor histidine kinase
VILCLSELATNAIRHSASGQPGGTFTVTTDMRHDGVILAVRDAGGPWQPGASPDGRMHGLGIVAELAAHLSVSGDAATGWTVVAHFGNEPAAAPATVRPGGHEHV